MARRGPGGLRGPSVLAADGVVVQVDAGGVGLLPGAVIVLEAVVLVSAEHHEIGRAHV